MCPVTCDSITYSAARDISASAGGLMFIEVALKAACFQKSTGPSNAPRGQQWRLKGGPLTSHVGPSSLSKSGSFMRLPGLPAPV